VHRICGRSHNDPTKLIFVIVNAETGFIYLKEWSPLNLKIIYMRQISKARAGY
jgi:hypothetical protein